MSIETRIQAINDHLIDDYKVLRLAGADLTGVNKNIVNLKMSWKERLLYFMNNGTDEVWNNWTKTSGTGTTLSLNNTEEAPMSLVYKGNTSQSGTPTPTSPIPVQVVSGDNSINVVGKNVFNYADTFIDNTTTFSVANVRPNTTYYCKAYNINDTYTGAFSMRAKINGVWTVESSRQLVTGFSYTTPNNCTAIAFNGCTNPSDRVCQVEVGSQATTYEAYKGASYPISLSSKNLFNPTYELETQYATNGSVSSGYEKAFDDIFISKHIANYGRIFFNKLVLKPGTYTVSFKASFSGSTKDLRYSVRDFANVVDVVAQTSMIISNDNTYSFSFSLTGTSDRTIGISLQPFDSTCGTLYLSDIQLEEGNLTPYEPYLTPIELCKIGTYQDKIFKNTPNTTDYDNNLEDNVWYLKKEIGKVVLNGSEAWVNLNYAYYSTVLNSLIKNIATTDQSIYVMADHFKGESAYQAGTQGTAGIYTVNTQLYLRGYNSTYADINALKTFLSSNNTTVYYVLATPTYETITDTNLIGQLEALKKSYEGQTNISQVNNDLPFELNITALSNE